MNFKPVDLDPGLYLVATPIGNARDITLRALDVLANADVIAAEDTRTARRLMDIHGIPVAGRPMHPYHDHSTAADRAKLLAAIKDGKSVAYVSEAGTPMVSDPGYALVRDCHQEDVTVTAVPGASAVLSALCVAGLPSDRFYFGGFMPPKSAARQTALTELRDVQGTLVFYESAKRIEGLLTDLVYTMGAERECAVCRELTKKFEQVVRGSLASVLEHVRSGALRGEIVVLVARSEGKQISMNDVRDALSSAMETMRVKDAADAVSGRFGLPRREVYQIALEIKDTT